MIIGDIYQKCPHNIAHTGSHTHTQAGLCCGLSGCVGASNVSRVQLSTANLSPAQLLLLKVVFLLPAFFKKKRFNVGSVF